MSKYSDKMLQRKKELTSKVDVVSTPAVVATVPSVQTTSQPHFSDHFSAGIIYQKRSDGVWCVAGITDSRFPRDVRIPGGTNKNATWENHFQTLCRELGEELMIMVDPRNPFPYVYRVPTRGRHVQFFYVVRDWTGQLRDGNEKEKFKDSDGEELLSQWVPLGEFWKRCFKGHREAFQKGIVAIVRDHPDPTFADQAVEAGIVFR